MNLNCTRCRRPHPSVLANGGVCLACRLREMSPMTCSECGKTFTYDLTNQICPYCRAHRIVQRTFASSDEPAVATQLAITVLPKQYARLEKAIDKFRELQDSESKANLANAFELSTATIDYLITHRAWMIRQELREE